MRVAAYLLLSLWPSLWPALAWAATPLITAPASATVASAVATSLRGLSISETGAGPTVTYTVTLTDTAGLLAATGTNVSGSGTTSLRIGPDTVAQLATALATLTMTTSEADTITVTAEDSSSQQATPATIPITTIPGTYEYLIYSTQAAALARSQQQCAAVKCDGVNTVYWWNVVGPMSAGTAGSQSVAAGSYAVEVRPGDPFFSTTTTVVAACAVGCGLTSTEQGNLVTAAKLAPLFPTAPAQAAP